MSEQTLDTPSKTITGYCEPWSLRSGEPITLRASSDQPGNARLSLVRIICGDPTSAGPGFDERPVTSALPEHVTLHNQPLRPGSFATIDLAGLAGSEIKLSLSFYATLPEERQTIASLYGTDFVLSLLVDDGRLTARMNNDPGSDVILRHRRLAERRWYDITCSLNALSGGLETSVNTRRTASPGRDLFELEADDLRYEVAALSDEAIALQSLVLGGYSDADRVVGDLDGRVGRPGLQVDATTFEWDFSANMAGRTVTETGGSGRSGELHQLPARGVSGPDWDGTQQRWSDAPAQWNAAHFHKDDLYDAGWEQTAQLDLPSDLPSGIYAFRVEQGDEIDRVPFFVRPAMDAATSDVALLMSSATYIAYANHRMLFEGADFIGSRSRLRPEHEYVRQHPELGRSMYEKHLDGSGVMFSSRRRPVLNLRPGADGWNFTPDTDINAFLDQTGVGHDVIADEDVHAEGIAALAPYRVIVTGSHPEYWSTAMLDALEEWQRRGGRLMYLGGNGFYWRVAFSDAWPGAMELRRAEDGVRNWSTGDGESYHAFSGEYGGMWRRNGRPPNELVGVGFAAQGFGRATYFDVNHESLSSRASWIWDGVTIEDGRIGTSGLGGGAAGQEIDRYDRRLGSPAHAIVLASATDFGPDMVRTKEEFEASIDVASPDPYVRGDIVFYETPSGGAVFSVSSISWFGALARNGFDNDVAQMTANVVRRFADPAPFELPNTNE